MKKISKDRFVAVLPSRTKSFQVFLPKIDRAEEMRISLMHYSNKENPEPFFYFFHCIGIKNTPCKFRFPLPYMDWLKTEKNSAIELTGYIGVFDKDKNRLAGKFFAYPAEPGGMAKVDFNNIQEGEEVTVNVRFVNGEPAAFARVGVKENGHSTFLEELETDRNGTLKFRSNHVESIKVYPSASALGDQLCQSFRAQANIEVYFQELTLKRTSLSNIQAILPEDMKSFRIRCPIKRQDMNLEISTTPYDLDEEFGPRNRIYIHGEHLNGPFEIRVPLPYQSKAKRYYDNVTYTGVVIKAGEKLITGTSLKVPATPGITVVGDLEEQ